MGWYINYHQKVPILPPKMARSAIYGRAIEMRSKRQHTTNMGYGGVTNATLRSKNQLLQQQPHAHGVVGCCCWGAGLLLGGRIEAWCPVHKEGNVHVPPSRKPGLHQVLTCVRGHRGCGNPIPGVVRKPGGLPYPCLRPESLEGLPRATHCTGRAQTSGNVTAWVDCAHAI